MISAGAWEVLTLGCHFIPHLLGKWLMTIAGLLIHFVQFSIDVTLLLLMGGTPFCNGLLLVVIACLEKTYILIEVIDLSHEHITLPPLIIS
jgi:hypothetical protein